VHILIESKMPLHGLAILATCAVASHKCQQLLIPGCGNAAGLLLLPLLLLRLRSRCNPSLRSNMQQCQVAELEGYTHHLMADIQ
jgi:hypothetical protein